MIPELVAEFGSALHQARLPENSIATLGMLYGAIRQNAAFLGRHPTALFQVIHNALSWNANDSRAEFFRVSTTIQEPPGNLPDELRSLLGLWIRQKAGMIGPFPMAGSLRPPEDVPGAGQDQSIGSFHSRILSLQFAGNPALLIAVSSRDKGDAAQDRKPVRGTIGVLDTGSGVELFPPLEISSEITASALSPNGQTIVLGDADGQIYVLDVTSREVTHVFDSGHGTVGSGQIRARPLSESGGFNVKARRLPTPVDSNAYEDARARDRAVHGSPWSAKFAENYQREKQQIHHLVWLNDGLQFGTLALDGKLRIWSVSTFQLEGQFDISGIPDNSGSIADGVAVTRSDALYCCKGVHLCRFDLVGQQLLHQVQLDERTGFPSRNGFRLSHDEQRLVIAGGSAVITSWGLPNLELKWRYSDPLLRLFQAAAFSAKDEWLLLGTNTGDVFVFETATGQVVAERNAVVGASITALDISEDGTLAIGRRTAKFDRSLSTRSSAAQLKGHRSHINDLAILPRLGIILTASNDRTAMLWDIADLANPIVLEGHTEGVGCVAVAREQDIAATAGGEGRVILWRIPDGQRIGHRLTGTDISLGDVAFSPNRTWIAACGNRYAWVWFLEGEEVYPFRTFRAEEDSVHGIVFDPSGEFLFALHSGSVIDGWRIRDGVRGHKDRLAWRDVEYRWQQGRAPLTNGSPSIGFLRTIRTWLSIGRTGSLGGGPDGVVGSKLSPPIALRFGGAVRH